MKYELQDIERLISGRDPEEVNENLLIVTQEVIHREVERIKKTFIHEVFSFEDERHLERYIQYHQQAIIQLMDKVGPEDNLHQGAGFHFRGMNELYYNGLEEILRFIERHFTRYFDQDAKAPEGYILLASKVAKRNISRLRKGLSAKRADPVLSDLLLFAIKRIIERDWQYATTYRKVIYANLIQKEIFRLLEDPNAGGDLDERLRAVMYYLNFNGNKAIAYFTDYFIAITKGDESNFDKIEKLSFELKRVNQSQVKPATCYNKHSPSLKIQLTNFLSEEIDYLERLRENNKTGPGKQLELFLSLFRVKIDASVAQLAFLIKILIEVKIVKNKNLTELLKFTARFFVSKRSEHISFDSLRAKYYNVETGTRESVKSILVTMINYIERSN